MTRGSWSAAGPARKDQAAAQPADRVVAAAGQWLHARWPALLAFVGVAALGVALRWPAQALTGFYVEDWSRRGPRLTVFGALLCLLSLASAAVATPGWRPAHRSAVVLAPLRRALRAWGLGFPPRPRLATLLLEPLALAVACWALTKLAMELVPGPSAASGPDPRWAMAAAAGKLGTVVFCFLGIGLPEELLNRGFVVVAARRGAPRKWLAMAVLASGVLFGAGHREYGLLAAVAPGLWGVALAAWAAYRRSLWAVVGGHALYDVYVYLLQHHPPA